MLQIVTKMYFREGVELHSTVQRDVLYTNCSFLRTDVVALPVGELAPSTGARSVSSVAVSVTEHLEAEHPDGQRSTLVATSGDQLIDELADVLSFSLNAVFTRDRDLARRLVPQSLDDSRPTGGARLFRRTFDPGLFVPEAEIEELRAFMDELLALRRSGFEAALRAIRRFVRATQRAVDDPTLAYVDMVAALESLSEGANAPALSWDRFDARKRELFESALTDADSALVGRVQSAAMEAERLGAKSRFVGFVMDHVSPTFFRTEAADIVRPIRGPELERALDRAYAVRSRSVHALVELPPEASALGERADTFFTFETGTMLSLEGLARLVRHVIRAYVDRAPVGVDATFDWRASLPGVLHMRAAPQYWIWQVEGFSHRSVERYFSGFVEHLAETLAGHTEGVTDMTAVLERIEELVPGTADGQSKTLMVTIYALWHHTLAAEHHRPEAERFLAKYDDLLHQVDLPAFVIGLLLEPLPQWTTEDWHRVATERHAERTRRRHLELSPALDAALQVVAAERLMAAGRIDDARTLAGCAVEELPGNPSLLEWERAMLTGVPATLDVHRLAVGLPQEESGELQPDGESGSTDTDDAESGPDEESPA